MLNLRSPKKYHNSQCTFPTTKLKNISCVFCRHQFYVRDYVPVKDAYIPLLLSCGHAACQNCGKNHNWAPCPLCKVPIESNNSEAQNLLPANIFVYGLMGLARTRPVHGDEPDIAFSQAMTTRVKQQSVQQGFCTKCGMQAVLRCLQCNTVLCHACSSKIHSKLKAQNKNESHFRVMLTDPIGDPVFDSKTCSVHNEMFKYYCEDCELTGCSECMLHNHKTHNFVAQEKKNAEFVEDFHRVQDKLIETMQRIRQAQKKVQKALAFSDELQNSETIEAAVNQHFAHLHGVLQNVERNLIDKLYSQRSSTIATLTEIQQRLTIEDEQVQSGLRMAAEVNECSSRVNLKDVIARLEEIAAVPCHVVGDPIADDQKIIFSCDPSIIEIVGNHCKIELPESSGYNLLTKSTLPADYEMEPLAMDETISVFDDTISVESLSTRTTSCLSLSSSQRSETGEFKHKGYNLVHVCHIESPSNFYVRLDAHRKQAIQLEAQLASYAANRIREPQVVHPNLIYAVKRSCEKWYRGRVNAINTNDDSPDTYEIFNLDYGTIENHVTKSRLRSIPPKIVQMPQTVMNCALYDIVPKDGIWDLEARKYMSRLVKPLDGRAVEMYIVNVKENTYLVDICNKPSNAEEGISVSVRDSLIFRGYGSFVTSQHLLRTSPQSVRRFFLEDLALNTYYDVKCSHVESPDCLYVQRAGDHILHLGKLMNDMSKMYKGIMRTQKGMIHVPEIGLPCAVEKAEGTWCRALITDVPAPRMVEVHLVDFGSKVTTNYEKIRKLHENFMISPGQAIKVTLADIKPRDGHWNEEAIELTKDYIEEKIARVIAFEKSESGYVVAMYINGDVNFGAVLASSYGESTGPRSSGVAALPKLHSKPRNRSGKVRSAQTGKMKKPKGRMNGYSVSSVDPTEGVDPYRVRVTIIRVESPETIYVADPTHETQYTDMMKEMQKFYNSHGNISAKLEWKVGMPCVAYSKCDRLFCRGKIIANDNSDTAQVFLYDLAITETVPVRELQTLPRKFWHTRTYAFKVKLAGISPCGGSSIWPLSSCEKLKDVIMENQSSKFYISKVDIPCEADLYVDLWVEEVKIDGPLSPTVIEINCINRMLVDSGLALPIKRYNEKTRTLAIELMKQLSEGEKEKSDEGAEFIENGNSVAESDGESAVSSTNSVNVSTTSSGSTLVSNGERPTAWLPAVDIADDQFLAEGSYVDFNCIVHLHSVAQSGERLRFIENTLETERAKLKQKSTDLVWKKGDLCIAKYHANQKWYRGLVRKVNGRTIEVEFIDYGNVESCDIETLKRRPLLTDIPMQRTKCVIYGLYPNTSSGKWKIEHLDLIHMLLVDQKFEVTVQKRMVDHLVVSIVLLNPVRCNLIEFLLNVLHLSVRVKYDGCDSFDSESGGTSNDSDEVVIEGYIEGDNIGQDADEVSEKKKVNEEVNEEARADDSVAENGIQENEGDAFGIKRKIGEEIVEKNLGADEDNEETEKDDFEVRNIEESEENDSATERSQKEKKEKNFATERSQKEEENINFATEESQKENEGDDFKEKNSEEKNDDDMSVMEIEGVKEGDDCSIKDCEDDDNHNVIIKEIKGHEDCEFHMRFGDEDVGVIEKSEENESTMVVVGEAPTVAFAAQLENTILPNNVDDDLPTDEPLNLTCDAEDVILSGTMNFSRISGRNEASVQEVLDKQETISLFSASRLGEGEFVSSTPHNDSGDRDLSYRSYGAITLLDELTVVKVQGSVIGRSEYWFHLLDNNNSELLTEHRKTYESIVADMQQHADAQPFLTDFTIGTPCCAKFSDGLWYRCLVSDSELPLHSLSGSVEVFFVDWGNKSNVGFNELRTMKDDWIEAPTLGLKFNLWGVEESPTADPDDFNMRIWNAYGGDGATSKIFYAELMGCNNQVYDVQIYKDAECRDLVYDSLIKEGFFVKKSATESE